MPAPISPRAADAADRPLLHALSCVYVSDASKPYVLPEGDTRVLDACATALGWGTPGCPAPQPQAEQAQEHGPDSACRMESFLADCSRHARTADAPASDTTQIGLDPSGIDAAFTAASKPPALNIEHWTSQWPAPLRKRRCFFHPNQPARVTWDLLMIPIFAQIMIAVPYNIGFGIIVEPLSVEFWMDVAIDVYFLFDVFLNFRTAYYCDRNFHLSGSGLVTNRCKIATHYAKTWLIIDIVSCAPIAYVALLIQYRDTGSVFSESPQASTASQSNRQAKLVKILRLLRLVKNMAKVAKLKKLKQVLAAYEDCLGALTASVTILKLLLVLLLLGHAMVHAHATMCTNHCHA